MTDPFTDAAARAADPLVGKKILLCPHEIGGQMQLLAEEMRRRGLFATAATYDQEWYGHVNDVYVGLRGRSKVGKHVAALSFAAFAAANYDIFHFFWGSSMYGLGPWRHLDLPVLRRLRRTVMVHFRGGDLVDGGAYADYLGRRALGAELTDDPPPISRPDQLSSLRRWERYAQEKMVSTPDLLRLVPNGELVPQCIDLRQWTLGRRDPHHGPVRIGHAPSDRRKKGTDLVIRAVDRLLADGLDVELALIEGLPAVEAAAAYRRCDIGVDQVLHGWYGKVAIEFMALGLPVVAYIDSTLASVRPDLPVVNAAAQDLSDVLRPLVQDHQRRAVLGEKGRRFVERHHEVSRVVDDVLKLYRRHVR